MTDVNIISYFQILYIFFVVKLMTKLYEI